MTKILFWIFSAINTRFKGKGKTNNQKDFFHFLKSIGFKKYKVKYFDLYFSFDPEKSTIGSRLILEKEFEKTSIEFLVNNLANDGYILDIGGNIGLYAAILASRKPKSTVISFEPSTSPFPYLIKNTANFENIQLVHAGIGNNEGLNTFYEYEDDALSSFEKAERSKVRKVTRALIMAGDHFVESFNITNITFIKIDVEGFEYSVLESLKNTLIKERPLILCELILGFKNSQKSYDLLVSLGYKASVIEKNSLLPVTSIRSDHYNYIFQK